MDNTLVAKLDYDLLNIIVNELSAERDLTTMATVALVNQGICRLVQAHLFRKVTIRTNGRMGHVDSIRYVRRRIRSFLAFLQRAPELKQYIKDVHLVAYRPGAWLTDPEVIDFLALVAGAGGLNSLGIYGLDHEGVDGREISESILRVVEGRVKRLKLDNIRNLTARFLENMGSLESLSLCGVFYASPQQTAPVISSQQVSSFHYQRVSYNMYSYFGPPCEIIHQLLHLSSLPSASFILDNEDDYRVMEDTCIKARESLLKLSLEVAGLCGEYTHWNSSRLIGLMLFFIVEYAERPIALEEMVSLQELRMTVQLRDTYSAESAPLNGFCAFLSHLKAPNLLVIDLKLWTMGRYGFRSVMNADWSTLDNSLWQSLQPNTKIKFTVAYLSWTMQGVTIPNPSPSDLLPLSSARFTIQLQFVDSG